MAFSQCFRLVFWPLWAPDRVDNDFFNRLGYSANIVQTALQNFEEMAEGSLAYREGMREARPWGIMCAMEKR
jgi:hypothetical protein